MNSIAAILDKFKKAEYDITSLEYVLKNMELACTEDEQLEMRYFINVFLRNIKTLKEDIHEAVAELDLYVSGESEQSEE